MLRGPEKGKSTGILENVLTWPAGEHPWFRRFARARSERARGCASSRTGSSTSSREPDRPAGAVPIGYETLGVGGPPGDAVTMIEFARDRGGVMPRMFAVNHHPEIVDRFRQIMILDQKRDRGEVTDEWYHERLDILTRAFPDEDIDQRLHLTSDFTLLGPLRFHLFRQVRRRAESLGRAQRAPRGPGAPRRARRAASGRRARARCSEARAMIPKPPFPRDLTLEQEIAEFERLKPRLAEVWDALTMREEEPHTSVVVPSLTLDQSELRKLPGASFYEERLLFLLIRLRNPRARMVYVTSQPVHPIILEYYLQFLAGIPASHARSRLTLLCADDASPRSLTEKILERPRLIERIRAGIVDPSRAYLTVFNSTPLERKLAVLLGVPLNGVRPEPHPPGHQVGQPQGLPRGGGRPARGLRGPAHPARGRGGARGAARAAARPAAGGDQAQRQLLRRGQRPLPLPRGGRPARRSARRCGRWSSRCHGDAGGLLRQVREHGRHRRGVHRGRGEDTRRAPSCASARAARCS